jgi:AcrR family transcriptional regulator
LARQPGIEATDGRLQRSERSRERIAQATIELIREGDPLPTGERVAARAGVGLRTVFRHFEDMEALFAEMQGRVAREVLPLLEEPIPDGDLDQRIRAFTRLRSNAFERIAPFERSGAMLRWRSGFLQRTHEEMVRELRAQLLLALPELEAASPAIQHGAELLTSFEAWDRLRSVQGLGRERAQEAIYSALLSLLDR